MIYILYLLKYIRIFICFAAALFPVLLRKWKKPQQQTTPAGTDKPGKIFLFSCKLLKGITKSSCKIKAGIFGN